MQVLTPQVMFTLLSIALWKEGRLGQGITVVRHWGWRQPLAGPHAVLFHHLVLGF